MSRTVNATAYAERHDAILDVAQQLVVTKGYEQMTIQDVLDALKLSKGGFFHYFPSKHALLEGIIDRFHEQFLSVLRPVAEAAGISPLPKLQRFFATMLQWKTARRPFFVQMLQVWYADENAIVRDKVRAAAIAGLAPLLAVMVRDGAQEGVYTTDYPDEVAQAILTLIWALSDTLARGLLANVRATTEATKATEAGEAASMAGEQIPLPAIERTVAAYTDAVERILGTPRGSLCIADQATLREWFPSAQDDPPPSAAATHVLGNPPVE